jgi:hypothetical protein
VPPLELPVTRHADVGDPPVKRGDDLDAARPVLGRERPLDAAVVHVGHAHKPSAAQPRLTAGAVAEAQLANDHRIADVELVAIVEQLRIAEPESVPALDAQLEH